MRLTGWHAQPYLAERVEKDMAALAVIEHDAELMLRVREGDGASFAVLLERHRSPVIHFLYRMVQNQAIAEELGQEVFLRVYRSRATYEPSAKFTTWLFRIATHLALNWIRDFKNEKRTGKPGPGSARWRGPAGSRRAGQHRADDGAGGAAGGGAAGSRGTAGQQRAAVLMHKYEELDYAQIARVLECSESAVKSLLFRAYETLRARLAHFSHDAGRGSGKE